MLPELVETPIATEEGHWYKLDGTPAYTVVGANGKERPTTLRDARKLGLVPSVTMITRLAAAPGLEKWKATQLLMSALTLPRDPVETEDHWIEAVWTDSKEQAKRAAQRGTDIHAAIEKVLRKDPITADERDVALIALHACGYFAEDPRGWGAETSFGHPLGFGGKIDLHSPGGFVIDFKSKDSLKDVKCWDEQFMQLAAYAHGLGMPQARCANVFVTRTVPAKAVLIEHTPEETRRGWQMFVALLEYWKAKTGYDVTDCSICRRRHGREVEHPCE